MMKKFSSLLLLMMLFMTITLNNGFKIKFNNIKKLLTTITTSSIILTSASSLTYAANDNEAFVSNLADVLEAKEVILPVKKYIENQNYDNARTNIKYVINQMQLQKKANALIQNSIDITDDTDLIDKAADANNRILNTASQLDSTIYTCVFVPSEDGTVNPTQEKYRKQSYTFYDSLLNDFNDLIAVSPEKELKEAQERVAGDLKKMPKILFKSEGLKQSGI